MQSKLPNHDSDAASDFSQALSHHRAGRLGEAEAIYRMILATEPNQPDALRLLGMLARQAGRPELAIALLERAIAVKPEFSEAQRELGNAWYDCGALQAAISAYREALRLSPEHPETWNNLGTALRNAGQKEEALLAYQQAVSLRESYADAQFNLGLCFWEKGRLDDSIRCYGEAARLQPDDAVTRHNLAISLRAKGRIDDAIKAYQEAIRLNPEYAGADNNLGNCYKDQGRIDLAVECQRRAVRVNPAAAELHSNLLYSLAFDPRQNAQTIYAESREWDERHGEPLRAFAKPHENFPEPERRLRIGYVSPDFRHHVVGHCILPLMREHDHERFEIFCYADVLRPDAITEEIRSLADQWRSISGVPDEKAAELIRRDSIDILVDLTLHMERNRLPLFARKPAPVQTSYLASCSTSGMEAMNYRFSDPYLDPPNSDVTCYTEELFRLPHSAWCYQPGGPLPAVAKPPCLESNVVTFASRNNFCKVSAEVLDLWMEMIAATPKSRLLLNAPRGSCREEITAKFSRRGLSSDRLGFLEREPWDEFLQSYGRVDIALDPFPYSGWITSCDALSMGVPVISLVCHTALSRGGKSILSNIGLADLVAENPLQYVEIAAALASDTARLVELRSTLRKRLEESPLCDAKSHARAVETGYREMWRKWCEGNQRAIHC